MGFKLNFAQMKQQCGLSNLPISDEETIKGMADKLNNLYGYRYFKFQNTGVCLINNKYMEKISRIRMSQKKQILNIDYECPICKRILPRKKFLTLSNVKMKWCCDCRNSLVWKTN